MGDHDIPRTASAYDGPLLIKHLLTRLESQHATQEIVYAHYLRMNYSDLYERITRVANVLRSLGVMPGDTVAVLDWDSHRYLECLFAVPMLGAVLHTVNIRLSPEQIIYTMNHAEDKVVLIHEDFVPLVTDNVGSATTVTSWILLSDSGEISDHSLPYVGEYEALLSDASSVYNFSDFDENTRATTFYTTGTTGLPKGVCFSHRQLVIHTLALIAALTGSTHQGCFHSEDVYMPITPMFHVHAWGMPYVATLLGVKQVYPGRYDPSKLIALIEKEGVTFSHCVPTILHMLVNSPDAGDSDFRGWKVIIGGAALSPMLARQALEKGIDVFGGYGMSETCPVLTLAQLSVEDLSSDLDHQLSVRCKAGRPVPMVELRVVNSEMEDMPLANGVTGEVVARSPWLTQSYLHDSENSEDLWRDGYLHTGDLGYFDESGYLKITDRLKDVIKSGGEWISSLMLEDIAAGYSGVDEAAAIGLPDEKWGERPLLLVVPKQANFDLEILRKEFQNAADKGIISNWAIPETIEIVDTIPKTSVGKIDKKQLREIYLV
ncbi:MAG: long-chain fatty acid--CoA ligase [Acidiferrobacteraceae bacterium]|nr:long-chain fatty acid--CoA ligase [Acidiferrobacteraceae bacterium]